MRLMLIPLLAASCAVIPSLPQEATPAPQENHISVRLGARDLTTTLTTLHTGVEQLGVFAGHESAVSADSCKLG